MVAAFRVSVKVSGVRPSSPSRTLGTGAGAGRSAATRTVGWSLSRMIPEAPDRFSMALTGLESRTEKSSSGSSRVSPTTGTVTVFVRSPGLNASVPEVVV